MDEDIVVEETRSLPIVTRELQIRAGSYDEAENTVEVTFTTGARGARFDWSNWRMIDEELATEASNVRLERLNSGAAVLNMHNRYELQGQIGVVVDGTARMEGGVGIATLRFSRREDVAPIVQDIRDGIIRNVSVGYVVHSYEITENDGARPLYRAVDWEPMEISFVSIPFDAGAQVRSQQPAQGGFPCIIRRTASAQMETVMEEDEIQTGADTTVAETRNAPVAAAPQTPAPQQRVATVTAEAVRTAARNAGLDAEVTLDLVSRHADAPFTQDALMADIGRRFAERDTPVQTQSRAPARPGNNVTMARAMSDAIFHRIAPGSELSEEGRQFRGMSLLRMAEEMLSNSGVNCRGMASVEIAERALHTTSDFPSLMSNALNRRLRAVYEAARPTYRDWARRAPNAPDFRNIEVVQLSAMPDLLRTNEAGEFEYGTASDGKVTYSVVTYGRIINITRQTIVNDDLRALDRIAEGFAGAASRLENRTVYSLLTANGNMPDGQTLFHASHGNLSGAAAIAPATLGDGRAKMRKQKGLQNEELNIAPRFLIVPTDQEQLAYQYTSSQYVPAKTTDINEFRAGGRTALEPIVEPVLDATSTSQWYLAAENGQVDTVEYCYLEGSEGVQLSDRIGFNVDGIEMKARLDFAAAVIDHRGLFRNG